MATGWGIIGTGIHADNFIAPALRAAEDTELVAICDIARDRAQEVAARHGVENVYNSLDRMLDDPDLDVVWISTPNNLHTRQTIQAAEAGKHILCEKPMALSVSDCELMIEACSRNNVKLGIDFQNRFHPVHMEARRLIQNGEIGEINMCKAQFCRGFSRGFMKGWRIDPEIAGAGALMGQGLHPIDLLRFLLDSEVVEVMAMNDEEPPNRHVEDMAHIILKFENGAHGIVICGILAPRPDNDAILYGAKAKISCKGSVGMWLQGELLVEGDSLDLRMGIPSDSVNGPELYIGVVDHFNKCIEEDSESLISGLNGMQMVRIANAIQESSRKGKAIKIA